MINWITQLRSLVINFGDYYDDKYNEDDDGDNDDDDDDEDDYDDKKPSTQDNPKHGEGASQTECRGELPFIVFSMWPVTISNQPINHI